jgi:hypothetical protein
VLIRSEGTVRTGLVLGDSRFSSSTSIVSLHTSRPSSHTRRETHSSRREGVEPAANPHPPRSILRILSLNPIAIQFFVVVVLRSRSRH